MSGNSFGKIFKISTFGESHGNAVGVVIDGCPAGIPIKLEDIQQALERRRPGAKIAGKENISGTLRNEEDKAEILSGVFEDYSTGSTITIIVKNKSHNSSDYDNLKNTFRPGHADFTYEQKYGFRDYRGGGRASGRETLARVAAGAVAAAIIENFGIRVVAYTIKAAGISCKECDISVIEKNSLRACDLDAAKKMEEKIAELRSTGDSAGGIVECRASGIPVGLGEPVFDKLDAKLAQGMLSIGAVKGIEFGSGFSSADMLASQNNDLMCFENDKIKFLSNNAGGILGGISNGNDIIFRVAVKPVPSIF
ncbi:MAG: chorismate synthase, partial [Treponema sp.]|nr:chorismate synthase [Treponema sp.]